MNALLFTPQQLVAHRGHQYAFPENSLIGILDAIAAGALNIEFDLQMTHDGALALYHDVNMLRISGAEKNITELSREELLAYHVSEPKRFGKRFVANPIQYLDDLLPLIKQHKEIMFYMEIKQESISAFGEEAIFESIKKISPSIPENIICISFNHALVKRAKEEGFYKTALVLHKWEQRNQLLAETDADGAFINYQSIPLNETITADKPIIVYEVKHAISAQKLLNRGAAAVETFRIRTLLNNL